jgi:hypothetical protein
MKLLRPASLLLLLGLGACATQPPPDLTPPPRKPADAKTQLESGRQYSAVTRIKTQSRGAKRRVGRLPCRLASPLLGWRKLALYGS